MFAMLTLPSIRYMEAVSLATYSLIALSRIYMYRRPFLADFDQHAYAFLSLNTWMGLFVGVQILEFFMSWIIYVSRMSSFTYLFVV